MKQSYAFFRNFSLNFLLKHDIMLSFNNIFISFIFLKNSEHIRRTCAIPDLVNKETPIHLYLKSTEKYICKGSFVNICTYYNSLGNIYSVCCHCCNSWGLFLADVSKPFLPF